MLKTSLPSRRSEGISPSRNTFASSQCAARGALATLSDHWRAVFLPPLCTGCGFIGAAQAICDTCRAELSTKPADSKGFSCFLYEGTMARLIASAKFRPSVPHAMACLQLWASQTSSIPKQTIDQIDAISFVPSHWRRKVWRGFDLAELLAYRFGHIHRRPVVPLLTCKRLKKPLSQTRSRQERRDILQDRFALRRHLVDIPSRILLVDDVFTTGFTLNETSRLLRNKGLTVETVVLAKTPLHTQSPSA